MATETTAGRCPSLRAWAGIVTPVLLCALAGGPLLAAETGRVEGRVGRQDGSAISGVLVYMDGSASADAVTDASGSFRIEKVAAGTHLLAFQLGSNVATEDGVEVTAGETTRVEKVVDWVYSYSETLTVSAASRRVERIVDAPAAITTLPPAQIEREASTGQLPKLFESAPGAELSQGGLYDFKFNVRGANTLGNRRIAVLVDGRNPSFPLLGAQEWAAATFPLDDLASAELVRGPSSALYGANAFNGILNLVTKSPRDRSGGYVRLAGGELSSAHLDLGLYVALGGGWHFKGLAGYHESEDFSRSRTTSVEYSEPCPTGVTVDCIGLEAVPLPLDHVEIPFASVRFDKDLHNGRSLVVEGGTSEPKGFNFASSAGRFQLVDVERPWMRFNFGAPQWNLLGYYSGRDAASVTLAPGSPSFSDDDRWGLELQTNRSFAGGRGRLVAGTAFTHEEVSTADPQGFETLLEMPVEADYQAVFAQLDYDLSDDLKLVLAGRWDDSDLHSGRLSPKASLVWAVRPLHTVRVGLNEAFLVPNYPEFFVRVPLIAPLDLSIFELLFCAPVEVSCGFDRPVPFLGVGNHDLEVETIRSVELGYRGILGGGTFLTADVYYSEIEDFVRSGVPLVGTALGRANKDFGPYVPPAGLPPETADALLAFLELGLGTLFPFLSNPVADEPQIPFLTLANVGRIETRGVELNVDHTIDSNWTVDFNYSWNDFDYREELPESPLGFNSPENKFNLGVSFRNERFTAAARYRWVDRFRWTEGVINGIVPSYEVVNLVAGYELADGWEIGLNVSNLLDDEHWEVFSGDLLGRRALAHVKHSWN